MRVDDSATLFRAYTYLGPAGLVGGLFFSKAADFGAFGTVIVTVFFSLALAPAVVGVCAYLANNTAALLYSRGDGTTQVPYSQAQALAATGKTAEAVKRYLELAAEFPTEPRPYLEAARLSRDQLVDQDRAIWLFARAFERQSPAEARATAREALELIERSDEQLPRALPMLAQIAEVLAHVQEGERAARELYHRKRNWNASGSAASQTTGG